MSGRPKRENGQSAQVRMKLMLGTSVLVVQEKGHRYDYLWASFVIASLLAAFGRFSLSAAAMAQSAAAPPPPAPPPQPPSTAAPPAQAPALRRPARHSRASSRVRRPQRATTRPIRIPMRAHRTVHRPKATHPRRAIRRPKVSAAPRLSAAQGYPPPGYASPQGYPPHRPMDRRRVATGPAIPRPPTQHALHHRTSTMVFIFGFTWARAR